MPQPNCHRPLASSHIATHSCAPQFGLQAVCPGVREAAMSAGCLQADAAGDPRSKSKGMVDSWSWHIATLQGHVAQGPGSRALCLQLGLSRIHAA